MSRSTFRQPAFNYDDWVSIGEAVSHQGYAEKSPRLLRLAAKIMDSAGLFTTSASLILGARKIESGE